MRDIFRDIAAEVADEAAAKAAANAVLTVAGPPEGLRHDATGTPWFENRPSSAQLVKEFNATRGAQHDAALEQAEQESTARRNRGVAYRAAAMCLADAELDLSSAQRAEIDKLARQLYASGTRLLRKRS